MALTGESIPQDRQTTGEHAAFHAARIATALASADKGKIVKEAMMKPLVAAGNVAKVAVKAAVSAPKVKRNLEVHFDAGSRVARGATEVEAYEAARNKVIARSDAAKLRKQDRLARVGTYFKAAGQENVGRIAGFTHEITKWPVGAANKLAQGALWAARKLVSGAETFADFTADAHDVVEQVGSFGNSMHDAAQNTRQAEATAQVQRHADIQAAEQRARDL